ncbi:MAG: YqjD family protein [Steroidobacteraceae bacterium]
MRYVNTGRLVRDLGAVVEDIDELIKAMGANATEAIGSVRERIGRSLHSVQHNWEDTGRHAMRRARGAAKSTNRYLQDNIWKVMGIAAAAGILAGVLLSLQGESPDEPRDEPRD